MDLLSKAYSSDSDDGDKNNTINPVNIRPLPPPKRLKLPSYPSYHPNLNPEPTPITQPTGSVPGRYVSKREKALLSSTSSVSQPNPAPPPPPPPPMGSILKENLRHDIQLYLRKQANVRADKNKLPRNLSIDLHGHLKPAFNAVRWSTNHAHLLASAGMDNTVYIWNVWNEQNKTARTFTHHNAAVKDIRWSPSGHLILSCGYDCSSRLVDVETGIESQIFHENQAVTVIKFHPHNPNLFLSGGCEGSLKLWDIRAGKTVHEYVRNLGPVLDVEFMGDGKQFISSSDVSKTNLSENSIVVWDVSREVPLSNQIYVEAYTCPCIRRHPFEPSFVAQSNGNYIAIFSTKHPFRLDKYKRYASHDVSGFPIKCCFNSDAEILASGSSDGCVYLYNVRSSDIIKKIKIYDQPCIDVAFHPFMPNVIACSSWAGHVSVVE